MNTLIDDLKKLMSRIEDLDDPTASESYRELIGDAHYSIEECISALNMANKPVEPTASKALTWPDGEEFDYTP